MWLFTELYFTMMLKKYWENMLELLTNSRLVQSRWRKIWSITAHISLEFRRDNRLFNWFISSYWLLEVIQRNCRCLLTECIVRNSIKMSVRWISYSYPFFHISDMVSYSKSQQSSLSLSSQLCLFIPFDLRDI